LVSFVQIALAQTEIRVTNLLGKDAITDPLPVRIELRGRGMSTRGVLEWWVDPTVRYRLPVDLPAGSRKEVELALPLDAWRLDRRSSNWMFQLPTLWWRGEGGDWRPVRPPLSWNNRLPVVVIGDAQGGFAQWRRANFALEYRFKGERVRSNDWALEPIYWAPRTVPKDWTLLLGVPLIVLVEGSERLSGEQWDALLAWLLAGGHLIVSVGSIGSPLRGTALAPLLPPLGVREMVSLTIEDARVAPSRPIPLIRSAGWREAALQVRSGDTLVACSRRVGRGMLTLCFADMTAPAWREWDGAETLINQWAGMISLPLFGISTPFESRSQRSPLALQHVLGVAVTFALFWLALYLIWRILRLRRQLIRAPLVLLMLVGLTSLVLVRLVPSATPTARNTGARLLLADQHLPLAIEHSYYSLWLPSGEHRLRWAEGTRLLAMRQHAPLSLRTTVMYETHTEILFQPFGTAEAQVQVVRLLKLPAPIRVQVRNGRYRVQNALPMPLFQVQVRRGSSPHAGGGAFVLSQRIGAGATVEEMPRRVRAFGSVLPREGEWLTAQVLNAPPSLLTPLNTSEEPTTLWVRIR
jgi:hypothetical protein